MLTTLLLSAYVLTVTAVYQRTKQRFTTWQLRAELAGMVAGLVVWVGLGGLIGGIE